MIALAVGDPSAGEARRQAERILAERRFHGSGVPDPLGGVLRRIGDLLEPIGQKITDWVNGLADGMPGGSGLLVTLAAAAALALAAWLANRSLRRRAVVAEGPGTDPSAADRRLDARSLERAADDAERQGDMDGAVRLRFRAGLTRLDERGSISVRPSTPTRHVARVLQMPEFDRVAAGFDAVAYGGRRAGGEDVALQRTGWDAVLRRAGAQ